MSAKGNAIAWLAIAAAGIGLYMLYKKQIGGAISSASAAVGGTIASPFEAAYTALTGNSPTPISTTVAMCYETDPVTGALQYDANGNVIQIPCAPGDVGKTPGTSPVSIYR